MKYHQLERAPIPFVIERLTLSLLIHATALSLDHALLPQTELEKGKWCNATSWKGLKFPLSLCV